MIILFLAALSFGSDDVEKYKPNWKVMVVQGKYVCLPVINNEVMKVTSVENEMKFGQCETPLLGIHSITVRCNGLFISYTTTKEQCQDIEKALNKLIDNKRKGNL